MRIEPPTIIQGGMGAALSHWRLAQAVSRQGQLGVVSGTALGSILSRRLQEGDPEGDVRRAIAHFPFADMAQRVLDKYFIPGGKADDVRYLPTQMFDLKLKRAAVELCIVGNFVEVFLAREGHTNPVGINYLEKIQVPHLASIYGALLAGVAVVIMGAGIPLAVPGILDALVRHEPALYPIAVDGVDGAVETHELSFDPADFCGEGESLPGELLRPDFLPIVSSQLLAQILLKRSTGSIDGFVIEGDLAGGHNAPPRGNGPLSDEGEPVYGSRDAVNLSAFRKMGLPFWLAGSYGSPGKLAEARAEGAAGVQVGTAFALCVESGLLPEFRRHLIRKALAGDVRVFTDPVASPTGFPFKVVDMTGSLSDSAVYDARPRVCDLGYLRRPYRREDGSVGYRCPAEPVAAYVAKGGKAEATEGRKCLCNALVANVGMPQLRKDGSHEEPLITMGNDLSGIGRFCSADSPDYSAADVLRVLTAG